MNLGEAVAVRILELCREYDYTINKLAMICGITQSTLNNIIQGGSKNPKIGTIKSICDGLNITLGTFFQTEAFDNLEQQIK